MACHAGNRRQAALVWVPYFPVGALAAKIHQVVDIAAVEHSVAAEAVPIRLLLGVVDFVLKYVCVGSRMRAALPLVVFRFVARGAALHNIKALAFREFYFEFLRLW